MTLSLLPSLFPLRILLKIFIYTHLLVVINSFIIVEKDNELKVIFIMMWSLDDKIARKNPAVKRDFLMSFILCL